MASQTMSLMAQGPGLVSDRQ